MTTVETKPLKLGVIGIGVGAAEMLPPRERAPYIDLFAGADVNPSVRERFQDHGVRDAFAAGLTG